MIQQPTTPMMSHREALAEANSEQLAELHADLKRRLLRSAYTDCYSASERSEMRIELKALSGRYRELTGEPLF